MLWNKEKVTFAFTLIIFVFALVFMITRGSGFDVETYERPPFRPSPGRVSPGEEITLARFQIPTDQTQPLRDPFQSISEWKLAPVDPLPHPPLDGLVRRVPLPGLLARSGKARPPRELVMPENQEEEEK